MEEIGIINAIIVSGGKGYIQLSQVAEVAALLLLLVQI